jgi:hypothetical protein
MRTNIAQCLSVRLHYLTSHLPRREIRISRSSYIFCKEMRYFDFFEPNPRVRLRSESPLKRATRVNTYSNLLWSVCLSLLWVSKPCLKINDIFERRVSHFNKSEIENLQFGTWGKKNQWRVFINLKSVLRTRIEGAFLWHWLAWCNCR